MFVGEEMKQLGFPFLITEFVASFVVVVVVVDVLYKEPSMND